MPKNHQRRPSPDRTEEDRVLSTLNYKKGNPTPQERACFEQLRGPLSDAEVDELTAAAETLRRVSKRLRALNLIRYWGAPVSDEQRTLVPLLAGIEWLRDLPDRPGIPLQELVRHLLFLPGTPDFLLDPFTHPEHYPSPQLRWDAARLTGVVGAGEGVARLREYDNFWTYVPESVFDVFVQTPDGVQVLQALIAAFVTAWDGPAWVAQVAARTLPPRRWGIRYALPAMLRVAHSLCVDPVSRAEAAVVAERRMAAIPEYSSLFGHIEPLGLNPHPSDWYTGWTARELLTPEAFEAADADTRRYLRLHFQDAQRGQASIWQLIHSTRTLLVNVDVESRRAFQFDRVYGERDAQADEVIGAWAAACGLTV